MSSISKTLVKANFKTLGDLKQKVKDNLSSRVLYISRKLFSNRKDVSIIVQTSYNKGIKVITNNFIKYIKKIIDIDDIGKAKDKANA